jgi:hypothetical protein
MMLAGICWMPGGTRRGTLHLVKGEGQATAGGLSKKRSLLTDGGGAPAALALDLEGVGATQVEGVFAVFARHGIHGLVEPPDLFRLHGVLEEGILDRRVLDEVQKDDAGGAVQIAGPEHPVE